ncbi:SDR family oxidoreductase [Natronospira bacteriovora]|uniref:SDR family oxidoreductase n=1 Tax=Natronospira bacteriovora TaxID=3069753 RepID=A0ABU0W459_9GAMM|nr:SDR family oxidoreductase [Natronospira sp. AB-CW4]MDQ2068776.1 SDR family oxidoreductase [Natronospira sp. AB-CW4]
MDLNLEGKHALVCGSSQGIGKATAETLAELGATVTLTARNEEALKAVCDGLPRPKGQAHDWFSSDFDRPEALETQIRARVDGGQRFHILINNSGGPAGGPAHVAKKDEFSNAFQRHLICNQILLQALLPGMREDGYGRIINIISTSVKEPIPGLGVSNTVRGAVASWAKTIATELAPDGITVNNILPGFTRTGRLKSLFEGKADKSGQSFDAVEQAALSQVPMGRFGQPEECANAIAFLASPAASYITGVSLAVDGGRTRGI